MAHQWRGVIREYADRLPVTEATKVITLGEGGTPLVHARHLSELTGSTVYLKVEGMNPTGSFKDRGMTMAMTAAVAAGAKAVVCASTGNTSASAAAYATAAGLQCAVLVPEGKIAMGKLSQAIAHGATLLQVDGNFDDCLDIARKLGESYPVFLVNSVNPARIEGQKTGAFEVVDALGDAPDIHVLPVGNAGNITRVLEGLPGVRGAVRVATAGHCPPSPPRPRSCGASRPRAPRRSCRATPSTDPDTIATAIRIGNPASWDTADRRPRRLRRRDRRRHRRADPAPRTAGSSAREGVFVEPGSAAGVAGLLKKHAAGRSAGRQHASSCTVTGHGLKDPQWALRTEDGSDVQPVKVSNDVVTVAAALGLEEK